uniref:Phage MuF C-terminal domain-containing protein n=1 Tax=uncultured bacterium URE12 TaxID=581111 RepID=C0JZS1_9BACT|nr:hypothetical protein pc1742 [uncultured bacterium URE12]
MDIAELRPLNLKAGQDTGSGRAAISLDDKIAEIIFGKNSDLSSVFHEFMHYFTDVIDRAAAQGNAKAAELKKKIDRIASGYNKRHTNISGQTSDEQKLRMEAVAEAFEMWLYEDRKAGQDTEADRLFKEIQDFFRKIYDCLKSISGVRLDPDTDAFFRKICGLDDIALTEYMRKAEQEQAEETAAKMADTSENGTKLYQAPYNETGSFGNSKKKFFGVSGTTNAKIYSDIQQIIHNPTLSNKTLISLGYVPDIYVALNLIQDKKLDANRATFRKAYGILTKAEIKRNLHNHKVPDKVIRNIGNLIADPLMIFESQKIPGRIIALITDCIFDANHNLISHPVMAVLSPSPNGKGYTLIPSVHDRNNVISMISNAESKNQIYYIKNKKIALNRIAYGKNTQPPSVWTGLSYQSMLPKNSIPSKEDIVKRFGLTDDSGQTLYQSGKSKNYNSRINSELNVNDEIEVVRIKINGKLRPLIGLFASYPKTVKKNRNDGHCFRFIESLIQDGKTKWAYEHLAKGSHRERNHQIAEDRKIVGQKLPFLLDKARFVERANEVEGKEGYDEVYYYYVPVVLENGNQYTVKITTLHRKNRKEFLSNVWDFDLYDNLGRQPAHSGTTGTARALADIASKISIAKMLRGLKGKDQRYYLSHFDEKGRFIKESDSSQTLHQSAKNNQSEKRYNKNEGKGNGTETYEATDDFRRIQEESNRLDEDTISSLHRGSRKFGDDERRRLGGVYERLLSRSPSLWHRNEFDLRYVNEKKGIDNVFVIGSVHHHLFHDIFEINRKYLQNGDLVDLHEDYSDCKCFITSDGLAGFAIEPDGNLVSVFSLNPKNKKGFIHAIKDFIREQGANKLDCFISKAQPLNEIYEKTLGFKTASILDFNYEVLAESKGKEYADNFVKTHGEAQVAFMVLNDNEVPERHFAKDQYSNAKAYQISQADKQVEIVELEVPKEQKSLKKYIQRLINNSTEKETLDKYILSFVGMIRRTGKTNMSIPKHLAGSSSSQHNLKERNVAVGNITKLIEKSFLVEIEKAHTDKIDHDLCYRFYVPIRIKGDPEGIIHPVRIVALHRKEQTEKNKAEAYDLILEEYAAIKRGMSALSKQKAPGVGAEPSHTISLIDFLGKVKGTDEQEYGLDFEAYQKNKDGEYVRIDNKSDSSQTLFQSAKNNLPETIEIDGEQKPTTNSEGGLIADTEEGIRNFYKWFGDSKAVDNDGRPLVMFHGTPNKGFEEFNTPT